uniref:Uncharacterized protein n=1 Tax=Plectus sambesii TaxID=2011161 RepID=A0A914XS20_9BILA
MFAFVKNESIIKTAKVNAVESVSYIVETEKKMDLPMQCDGNMKAEVRQLSKWNASKFMYLPMTIFAGIFFGEMLSPTVYVQDNVEGASQEGLDYVFSHISGVFAGSTIYFIIYCIFKRNRPFMNPETTLPSVTYGCFYSGGMILSFVSNKLLSQAVSFPIVIQVPGIVGACWDVFYFKSIKGRNNLILLAAATTVAVIGVSLVALSR